jgi:hypothetical protein
MLKITTLAVALGLALAAPAYAQDPARNPEAAGVRAALDHYIAGHATGNGAEHRQAFHDEAKLFWMRDGKFMQRTDDEYIAGSPGKPADDEAQRKRTVQILDITGDVAVAKVVLDYPTVTFVDYMSLVKTESGWKIVNKIFNAQPKPKS